MLWLTLNEEKTILVLQTCSSEFTVINLPSDVRYTKKIPYASEHTQVMIKNGRILFLLNGVYDDIQHCIIYCTDNELNILWKKDIEYGEVKDSIATETGFLTFSDTEVSEMKFAYDATSVTEDHFVLLNTSNPYTNILKYDLDGNSIDNTQLKVIKMKTDNNPQRLYTKCWGKPSRSSRGVSIKRGLIVDENRFYNFLHPRDIVNDFIFISTITKARVELVDDTERVLNKITDRISNAIFVADDALLLIDRDIISVIKEPIPWSLDNYKYLNDRRRKVIDTIMLCRNTDTPISVLPIEMIELIFSQI